MQSLNAVLNRLSLLPLFAENLNSPANPFLVLPINQGSGRRRRLRRRQVAVTACFNLVAAKENGSFGFVESRRGQYQDESSWCCPCKGWESEGGDDSAALEAEILEFMASSEKPEVFPTKRELVDAGRVDLVEAIVKKGGWLSLGWDMDENSEEESGQLDGIHGDIDCRNGAMIGGDVGGVQQRAETSRESDSLEEDEVGSFGVSSVSNDSSQSASLSGRSLGIGDEEVAGIEGILSRLEKQRNLSFGINLGKNGYSAHDNGKEESHFKTSDTADLERIRRLTSGSPNKDICSNFDRKLGRSRTKSDFDGLRNSLEPETWRSWSMQLAGSSDTEFEAAEISFNENQTSGKKDSPRDEIHEIRENATDALDVRKDMNHSQIQTRLQHLELELSSALRLLRSKSEEPIPEEGHERLHDLRQLSDAWEFQENEVMNAQNRLRSIRAKLAVLEGKMALAIIDAQKMAEEKQKKIDGARRALQLLRSACVVWPNTASEVLLAGSFDGWTTQRKMEKSSTGIFSVCLKLYPGRYEIKFIVDGIWRTDPLRPIVHNNGHENNLLIIT